MDDPAVACLVSLGLLTVGFPLAGARGQVWRRLGQAAAILLAACGVWLGWLCGMPGVVPLTAAALLAMAGWTSRPARPVRGTDAR